MQKGAAAIALSVKPLLDQELINEVPAGREDAVWREDADGGRIALIITRVTYRRDTLAWAIGSTGFRAALGVADPDPSWPRNADDPAASFIVTAPLLYRRRGEQTKIVVDGGTQERRPDPTLVTMIVRARDWADRLINGEVQTMAEIAAAEGVSMQYVVRLMPLAFLAPQIVE